MAIICSCNAVTTAAARRWIDAGATTTDALGNCTGAGSDCGSCHPTLEALLAEYAGADQAIERCVEVNSRRRTSAA